MFTPGMLKIMRRNNCAIDMDEFFNCAAHVGYEAAAWNGDVYCLSETTRLWVKTPFKLSDFELEILPSQIEMYRSEG